jgi:hypothetical protein
MASGTNRISFTRCLWLRQSSPLVSRMNVSAVTLAKILEHGMLGLLAAKPPMAAATPKFVLLFHYRQSRTNRGL